MNQDNERLSNESLMSDKDEKLIGYVYILEVRDIVLPVCKIGMTTRSPYQRCAEINNSSTGDFIWSVAHYVAVDDCKALESLVHSTVWTSLSLDGNLAENIKNGITELQPIYDWMVSATQS